eukprot:TRINITY_DN1521_c0_g1_i1.p1 TRINITY_DN1521_c0_g1~~TRINITY_DN1521_c0_g1_i1.p1  ORF type:complete len:294 (+),score=100.85 TRINITY_DN1521_c0_g1_i1:105-986(+)
MAVNTNYKSPNTSPVDQIRGQWAQNEDLGFAEALQYQEIKGHLRDNKRKNIQIREDFPQALLEQENEFQLQLEEACACDMMDPPAKSLQYNDCEYKVELARPARVTDEEPIYENDGRASHSSVLGVLSMSDIACAQRAEEILEQEKEDAQLALRLQNSELGHDESKDYALALHLHEKEKAKIARAKERSRLKKLAMQESMDKTEPESISDNTVIETDDSKVVKNDGEEAEEDAKAETPSEAQKQLLATYRERMDEFEEVVPPYMPMQCQSGKKSLALEDKLRRRKEKEGCSQQ